MNLMKCEVCGSNELTKKDDLFVCDFCGAKYSVEAVRKMVMEGRVEVSGSISVDQTSRIKGLLQSAIDDYEDSNIDSAVSTVNEILLIEPYLPDALFLKALLADEHDTYQKQRSYDRAMENLDKSLGIFTKEDYDYECSLVKVIFRNYMPSTNVRVFFDNEQIFDDLAPYRRITLRYPSGTIKVSVYDTSGNFLIDGEFQFRDGIYLDLQQKIVSGKISLKAI